MGTKVTVERGEAEWVRLPVGSLSAGQLYETDAGVIFLAHPYGLTRLDGAKAIYDVNAHIRVRKVRPGTKIILEAE